MTGRIGVLLARVLLARVLVVLVLPAVLLIAGAPPAAAHAGVVSTIPADRAVLARTPSAAVLTFNETVRPVAFTLYDGDGHRRPLTGEVADRIVRIALPADLAAGGYVIGWRVVSADSHPLSGALSFAVGATSSTAAAEAAAAAADSPWLKLAHRSASVLGYLGLLVAIGVTVFRVVVLRAGPSERSGQRMLRIGIGTAVLAQAVQLWWAPVREPGTLALALVAAGGAGLLASSALRNRRSAAVGAGLGVLTAAASVLPVGHSRSVAPQWLMAGADLIHTATGAVWFGGVIGLALYLTAARRSGQPVPELARVLARFSALAAGSVAVLAVTGAILAVLTLGSVADLLTTGYGRTLLVKFGLVAVVGVLAVWNKAVLVPAVQASDATRQWRRLIGAVRDEAAILVAVVALTGLLVSQNPAPAPAGSEPASAAGVSFTTSLGAETLTGTITPARRGSNVVEFEVRDPAGQPVSPISSPTMSMSLPAADLGPILVPAQPAEVPGRYRSTVTLPVAGEWRLTIPVRISRYSEPVGRLPVAVREAGSATE